MTFQQNLIFGASSKTWKRKPPKETRVHVHLRLFCASRFSACRALACSVHVKPVVSAGRLYRFFQLPDHVQCRSTCTVGPRRGAIAKSPRELMSHERAHRSVTEQNSVNRPQLSLLTIACNFSRNIFLYNISACLVHASLYEQADLVL